MKDVKVIGRLYWEDEEGNVIREEEVETIIRNWEEDCSMESNAIGLICIERGATVFDVEEVIEL